MSSVSSCLKLWVTTRQEEREVSHQVRILKVRRENQDRQRLLAMLKQKRWQKIRRENTERKQALQQQLVLQRSSNCSRLDQSLRSVRSLESSSKLSIFQNRMLRKNVADQTRLQLCQAKLRIRDNLVSQLRSHRVMRNKIYLAEKRDIIRRRNSLKAKLEERRRNMEN
jgi:hypothetical protein